MSLLKTLVYLFLIVLLLPLVVLLWLLYSIRFGWECYKTNPKTFWDSWRHMHRHVWASLMGRRRTVIRQLTQVLVENLKKMPFSELDLVMFRTHPDDFSFMAGHQATHMFWFDPPFRGALVDGIASQLRIYWGAKHGIAEEATPNLQAT